MERKIGEIFEYNGEWYQCVRGEICADCTFVKKYCNENPLFEAIGGCSKFYRKDSTSVIFKKLEKVGEPYEYLVPGAGIIMVQEYIIYNQKYIRDAIQNLYIFDYQNGRIAIEVKQNQEDMEEKKPKEDNSLTRTVYNYVNGKISDKELIKTIKEMPDEYPYNGLKEFDLEAAKSGKPVCTRDGAKARIICFDAKSDTPIIALITTDDGTEITFDYLSDGTFFNSENPDNDLMMLPEKKEGWVNVYKERIYSTKEEAIEATYDGVTYVDTVKVCWEE